MGSGHTHYTLTVARSAPRMPCSAHKPPRFDPWCIALTCQIRCVPQLRRAVQGEQCHKQPRHHESPCCDICAARHPSICRDRSRVLHTGLALIGAQQTARSMLPTRGVPEGAPHASVSVHSLSVEDRQIDAGRRLSARPSVCLCASVCTRRRGLARAWRTARELGAQGTRCYRQLRCDRRWRRRWTGGGPSS